MGNIDNQIRQLESSRVKGAIIETLEEKAKQRRPESTRVLEECIALQLKKSQDYQNPVSNVVQNDHYRRGIGTIHDMIHQKLLRAQSLIESAEQDPTLAPNFESIEDTYKDLINYASFAVSYLRYTLPGQRKDRDIFNRKIKGDDSV